MGCLFQLTDRDLTLQPGQKILKASEYARFVEAEKILEEARAEAKSILERAEVAYEAKRQEGYEDGVAEGQIDQAEKMLETGMQVVEYLERLERQVVEVVNEAVRKVIGEMDSKERIVRVVRTQLEQVRGRQHVLIRVCPEEEPVVRKALQPMFTTTQTRGVELMADARMKPGSCVMESEMGVVDASLDVQLKAIERALTAKIGASSSGI